MESSVLSCYTCKDCNESEYSKAKLTECSLPNNHCAVSIASNFHLYRILKLKKTSTACRY